MTIVTNSRHHDFSYGHRIYQHEGACSNLHGHNGRIHFHCYGEQDPLGRVIDFKIIKTTLCEWVEQNWDHKMLIYNNDPWLLPLSELDPYIVSVPFNPSAENMAKHILTEIGPKQLQNTGVTLWKVVLWETRKCNATAKLSYLGGNNVKSTVAR